MVEQQSERAGSLNALAHVDSAYSAACPQTAPKALWTAAFKQTSFGMLSDFSARFAHLTRQELAEHMAMAKDSWKSEVVLPKSVLKAPRCPQPPPYT